jgi:hypothetical protein
MFLEIYGVLKRRWDDLKFLKGIITALTELFIS